MKQTCRGRMVWREAVIQTTMGAMVALPTFEAQDSLPRIHHQGNAQKAIGFGEEPPCRWQQASGRFLAAKCCAKTLLSRLC